MSAVFFLPLAANLWLRALALNTLIRSFECAVNVPWEAEVSSTRGLSPRLTALFTHSSHILLHLVMVVLQLEHLVNVTIILHHSAPYFSLRTQK